MGKTTKKKKSKRLKRRIGLIAIGGLSMVLTVCLSVGATLAWFAGSTWASKDLFMGGPVYVEMAGRGQAGDSDNLGDATTGEHKTYASWQGGNGQLDIIASSRSTGTANTSANTDVLLPGQKMLVYSQARVYSTAYNTNVNNDVPTNLGSSGANVNNTNHTYTDTSGRKKTTTTSVLRAKFSIEVEFDPTVGFNNFTDAKYADNYPVQSGSYTGETDKKGTLATTGNEWWKALGATPLSEIAVDATGGGRRDAVEVATGKEYVGQYVAEDAVAADGGVSITTQSTNAGVTGNLDTFNANTKLLWAIQKGTAKSIYKWKYVSATQYEKADGTNGEYKMSAPFDGKFNTSGTASAEVAGGSGVGFYGVWEVGASKAEPKESDSFYKVRTKEYLQSYKESYRDEYNRDLVLTIQNEMENLENALNKSFVKLVNESSDKIMEGYVNGFVASDDGTITDRNAASVKDQCSWLYVDPSIGRDTNASDSATSTGGWWYLVESANTASVTSSNNRVVTETDSVVPASTEGFWTSNTTNTINTSGKANDATVPTSPDGKPAPFQREGSDGLTNASSTDILNAKLYEIKPEKTAAQSYYSSTGTNSQVTKIVSVSFPFVNGMFELPGKELTNIFANSRISFQISFQALQAFFPWSPSIDGLPSGHQLAGLGKALNIGNAIPIYNEAFNYLAHLSQ